MKLSRPAGCLWVANPKTVRSRHSPDWLPIDDILTIENVVPLYGTDVLQPGNFDTAFLRLAFCESYRDLPQKCEKRRSHDDNTMNVSNTGPTPLDYADIRQYWNKAKPSPLGPYMMEGFGLPTSAGRYRFRLESKIVEHLTCGADRRGTVLDLGSGAGHWTEFFAQRFSNVIAVEASSRLYGSMVSRCSSYPNASLVQDDVLSFHPEGPLSLIFLGGMLMYLNEQDAVDLLRRITPQLSPGGMVLCRESTVRTGTYSRQGNCQAVYRSAEVYSQMFEQSGLEVTKMEINVPYVLLQMGCESINAWKAVVPAKLQGLPLVGRLVYSGLRLGHPLFTRVPEVLQVAFPKLTNHFFLLRARKPTAPSRD